MRRDPPYSSTTAFLGTWEQVIHMFILSGQKPNPNPNPVSKRQLVVYALWSAWPSICYDPQTAFPLVTSTFMKAWLGLFILPASPPHGACSTHHWARLLSDRAHVSRYSVHGVAVLFSRSGIITDRYSFFLTENLNIYRLQGCPWTWILFTRRNRAASPFIGIDFTCLTSYHKPRGDL